MKKLSFLVFLLATVSAFGLRKDFDFMGLHLGMSQTEATNLLSAQTNLILDESRFFGKINDALPFVMKAMYYPYINNVYIQFNSNQAYCITIQFNPGYFDFLTLAETLEEKYGLPVSRSSDLEIWLDPLTNSVPPVEEIQLRLEYPTTVKVFDAKKMREVNNEVFLNFSRVTNESAEQSNRRSILGNL